jgi:hypothetical protein
MPSRYPEALERFGLVNGQFFSTYHFKNLHWYLNGKKIGYGDLRDEDIMKIHVTITEGETFEGFNVFHGSEYQRRSNPVVVITSGTIEYPQSDHVRPLRHQNVFDGPTS